MLAGHAQLSLDGLRDVAHAPELAPRGRDGELPPAALETRRQIAAAAGAFDATVRAYALVCQLLLDQVAIDQEHTAAVDAV